tara:strand:- start:200 stop:841 length:642 start_codon:yes stop_codon:yes gene_type:complete
MPLIIGIENGTDKGFTEKELGLTNGFLFGVVCMHAGVGRIGDKAYCTVISAEEAQARFKLVLDTMPVWEDQQNTWEYKWLTDLDNIKRLEEHDWTCNAGSKSAEEFLHHMQYIMMEDAVRGTPLDKHLKRTDWRDLSHQNDTIRNLIGMCLNGNADDWHREYGNFDWLVEQLTDAFAPYKHWDLEEKFYDGMYLVWDDDEYKYTLSDKPEGDE